VKLVAREWTTVSPGAGSPTRGLTLKDDAHRRVAEQLADDNRLFIRELRAGLEIETRSYVGRIALGDLTITIVPKLAPETLLGLFAYAFDMEKLDVHEVTRLEDGSLVLEDLVVMQLVKEAHTLMRGGLARRYEVRREWLGTPRGRIRFDELARGPMVRAELPCEHHARQVDWKLNRVVAAGLRHAVGATASPALRARMAEVARAWAHEVPAPASISVGEIARVLHGLDRQTERYRRTLTLLQLVLGAMSLGMSDDGPAIPIPGFLYDMNALFQTLVTRFLDEHLDGVDVASEVDLHGIMRYVPGHNPRGVRPPLPRADIELRRGRSGGVYLDAKYRDLWAKNLPREMLYQLALYAVASSNGEATILYPTESSAARDARIELRPAGSASRYVVLRPVVLSDLRDVIGRRDRRAGRVIAQRLAYGA
jgi:5-methylcytosine-specific restriction enzyme subunit McrC